MASPESFTSKFALGVLPEIDTKKDPLLYNEIARLRGAIRSIAAALDSYTLGGAVTAGYIPYGNGTGLAIISSFTFTVGSQLLKVPSIKCTSLYADATTIGFYAKVAAPTAQPTTSIGSAAFVVSVGTAVNDASTFDGYTIKQIVTALRSLGLLA